MWNSRIMLTLGNAWTPARFWNVVVTSDPEKARRLKEQGYLERKASGSEWARWDKTHSSCLGDIADRFSRGSEPC